MTDQIDTSAEAVNARANHLTFCGGGISQYADLLRALSSRIEALTAERDALTNPPPWEDRDDAMSPAILQSHPVNSKDYASYSAALELVSNRHGKGALVGLVCHLLRERDAALAQVAAEYERGLLDAHLAISGIKADSYTTYGLCAAESAIIALIPQKEADHE